MSESRCRTSWFGIALIIVGAAMLVDHLNIINIAFSSIFWPLLMVIGIFAVGKGFSQNRLRKIYWGTVLFLYSLFFFLRSIDSIELYSFVFLPASFIIFGVGFFMMYLNNFKDWHFLIPALLLTGIGSLFLLTEYGCFSHREVWDAVRTYWPVILILFGLAILLKRYNVKSDIPAS
ncbi:MAG: DUF5668 domain-containing protein [Bacteroidota bacterium]|nr:DUF5668 domain-containing protein [Bacteroidota bacterium]